MFTAEYSLRQGCFHVSSLDKTLETNIGSILRKVDVDYLIFAITKTHEEASLACDKMRKTLKDG